MPTLQRLFPVAISKLSPVLVELFLRIILPRIEKRLREKSESVSTER